MLVTDSASTLAFPTPKKFGLDLEASFSKETGTDSDSVAVDPYLVVITPDVDPKKFSSAKKWFIIVIVSIGGACVNSASSMPSFIEPAIMNQFHVSRTVAILGSSLFLEGLAIGPLLVGPFSEVLGRNLIYRISFLAFWLCNWPVAFAPNIAVYLVFRFLCGFCGSAFLSVSAGTVGDLFNNMEVITPMAAFGLGPFAGPILGPVISGFISQHLNWRWVFRLVIIWSFVELLALSFLLPETYEPVLLKRIAETKRKATGDQRYYAPLERQHRSLSRALVVSCYRPFQLIIFDLMAFLLNVWNALILGILYLAFQVYPIIYEEIHGFNAQSTGLTFFGIGLGMVISVISMPLVNVLTNRYAAKFSGPPPPEIFLKMGQVGAVMLPVGLFWIAFTTYPQVHWIVPIIASVFFGMGIIYSFASTLVYMVVAYRPIVASALASNSVMRSSSGAAFSLFANSLYARLGTVGATALLAGLAALLAPLPFIFDRYGAQIRQRSRFAAK